MLIVAFADNFLLQGCFRGRYANYVGCFLVEQQTYRYNPKSCAAHQGYRSKRHLLLTFFAVHHLFAFGLKLTDMSFIILVTQ